MLIAATAHPRNAGVRRHQPPAPGTGRNRNVARTERKGAGGAKAPAKTAAKSPGRIAAPGKTAAPVKPAGGDEAASESAREQVIADAARLVQWGRKWFELAELIARMAGRPPLPEVRRILKDNKTAIEQKAGRR